MTIEPMLSDMPLMASEMLMIVSNVQMTAMMVLPNTISWNADNPQTSAVTELLVIPHLIFRYLQLKLET